VLGILDWKPIDRASIARGLKTEWFGRTLVILDECSSTNDVLERMAAEGAPHGAVVIAETQRAGRGRFGRAWYSPRGGIWMSVLIKSQYGISAADSLPVVAAVGTAKTLLKWRVEAEVRWPNDVVAGGRKIVGILVESKSKGNELIYSTVGIGINVNVDTSKIESIRSSSTSLMTLLGTPINREELIVGLLLDLEAVCESLQESESAVLDLLRAFDYSRGKRVRVRTADRVVTGLFDGYETLARVRILSGRGFESVETSAVVSVDYESY